MIFVRSFDRSQRRFLSTLLPAMMIADAVGTIGRNEPAEFAISVTLSPLLLPFETESGQLSCLKQLQASFRRTFLLVWSGSKWKMRPFAGISP